MDTDLLLDMLLNIFYVCVFLIRLMFGRYIVAFYVKHCGIIVV